MTIIKSTKGKGLQRLIGLLKGMSESQVFIGVTKDTNARPDGGSNAVIGMVHEFGSPANNIDERSHLRATIIENGSKYSKMVADDIPKAIKNGMSSYDAYSVLGTQAMNDVKLKIASGNFKALKEATEKRKGSTKPLIDTGAYRNSITYRVDK